MPDEIQTHDKGRAAARVNQASVARLAPKVCTVRVRVRQEVLGLGLG